MCTELENPEESFVLSPGCAWLDLEQSSRVCEAREHKTKQIAFRASVSIIPKPPWKPRQICSRVQEHHTLLNITQGVDLAGRRHHKEISSTILHPSLNTGCLWMATQRSSGINQVNPFGKASQEQRLSVFYAVDILDGQEAGETRLVVISLFMLSFQILQGDKRLRFAPLHNIKLLIASPLSEPCWGTGQYHPNF